MVRREQGGQGRSSNEGGDGGDSVPIGALRAFVTVLVVAHHSVIAYLPEVKAPSMAAWTAKGLVWTAFPVVDSQRVPEFGLLVSVNDVFFMSLMFFISGLFVWPSLMRKGALRFAGDRIVRLGLPFAIAASLFSPLAYYPSYLQGGGAPDLMSYAAAWLSLDGAWPAGPAWFLWLLLAFDLLAVFALMIAPRFGSALGRLSANADVRPWRYVAGLIVVSGAGFLAMNLYLGYDAWVHWGPFFVQAGRVLHYAVYFFAGIGVGAYGLDRGLLDVSGKLARRWWLWLPGGLAGFVAVTAAYITAAGMKFQPQIPWTIGLCALFAIACAALSFAFVAVFVRFCKRSGPVLSSLRRSAYGIYLLHYVYAIWLQFALLNAPITGAEKGGIVFATTLLLSWATTALLRSFPPLGRII